MIDRPEQVSDDRDEAEAPPPASPVRRGRAIVVTLNVSSAELLELLGEAHATGFLQLLTTYCQEVQFARTDCEGRHV
jgi:hypothetical protein